MDRAYLTLGQTYNLRTIPRSFTCNFVFRLGDFTVELLSLGVSGLISNKSLLSTEITNLEYKQYYSNTSVNGVRMERCPTPRRTIRITI